MRYRFSPILLLLFQLPCFAQPRTTPPKPDASDKFFASGQIPRLKIEITPEEMNKLRQKDREYVKCTIMEDDKNRYEDVGIHLKGAAGSFRGIDDRPALSLNFDKFKDKQRFHDLDKLHLNNSVQDGTYLHELLCSELFLANGVPTARTTHARVWLNGRDLGFYVLKEGYNKTFLKRHFVDASGNLYDGGFLQEIDAPLKKMNGDGPSDHSDLKALVAACREPDATKRWQRVEELVDIDNFLTFMAIELLTCHWDGYVQKCNNYRVYFDPKTKKAYFLPHGMDQMFWDPNFPILHTPGALVASTIMSNPEWRAKYREKLNQLIPQFAPVDKLNSRIDEVAKRLRPVLAAMSKQAEKDFLGNANNLKEQLKARAKNLEQQNAVADPKPMKFNEQGIAHVTNWEPRKETDDAKVERLQLPGEPKTLSIEVGPGRNCIASWRSRLTLPAGAYRLEASAKAENITGRQDQSGAGAGIRLSGSQRTNKLEGNSDWRLLNFEFNLDQSQEVELVAELRATAGQVRFDAGSMRLVRRQK